MSMIKLTNKKGRALGLRTKKQVLEILEPSKNDAMIREIAQYIDEKYDGYDFPGNIRGEAGVVKEETIVYDVFPQEKARAAEPFSMPPEPDVCCQSAPVDFTLDLEEFMGKLDAGFSETLLKLIDLTGKKDSDVYKKANVDRKLFSKIRNNPEYKPSKATALAFAVALELDLEETKDLIARAGYALSHSSKFDIIVEYFIVNKIYDILKLNEMLYEFDQPLIGA